MRTRWEYLVISAQYTLVPAETKGEPSTWLYEYALLWPGAQEEEKRPYPGENFSNLLAEVGRDGWELVTAVVNDTWITEVRGIPNAGIPVRTAYTFKRPIE